MPLYTYNGGILRADGGLAANENCCCDGGGGGGPCPVAFSQNGWYTSDGEADLVALLQSAGYQNVSFIPQAPFAGAPVPYTDECGQTYYLVTAECCGQTFGCTPALTSGPIRGIQGPGNQVEPCGEPVTNTGFVDTCCVSAP